jgi:hypothetical protein
MRFLTLSLLSLALLIAACAPITGTVTREIVAATEVAYEGTADEVFSEVLRVISVTPGWNIRASDQTSGYLVAETVIQTYGLLQPLTDEIEFINVNLSSTAEAVTTVRIEWTERAAGLVQSITGALDARFGRAG